MKILKKRSVHFLTDISVALGLLVGVTNLLTSLNSIGKLWAQPGSSYTISHLFKLLLVCMAKSACKGLFAGFFSPLVIYAILMQYRKVLMHSDPNYIMPLFILGSDGSVKELGHKLPAKYMFNF